MRTKSGRFRATLNVQAASDDDSLMNHECHSRVIPCDA